MKHRIAIWAVAGFLISCCWVIYTFVASPESANVTLNQPWVQAALFTTCPISLAGRYVPLAFWSIPPINAATYALIGVLIEAFTHPKILGLKK